MRRFRKGRVIAPLHTEGPIAITHDARYICTCVHNEVLLTDIASGIKICTFQGDASAVTSLCISPSSKCLLVFVSSNSFRIYDLPSTSDPSQKPLLPTHTIPRAHDAPVHVSTVDSSSSYAASGSADGIVKVWDIQRGYATHVFKGHGGVVSALAFDQRSGREVGEAATFRLFTGSVDSRIRLFDLTSRDHSSRSKPDAVLDGHVSVPRGIAVSSDGKWLVSGGRDAVVLIWYLATNDKTKRLTTTLVKTISTSERVEAVGILESNREDSRGLAPHFRFYTGGEHGIIKVWDAREGTVVYSMAPQHSPEESDKGKMEEQREIVSIFHLPVPDMIVSLHADQNILFHSVASHDLTRQLIGFNDEITDGIFLNTSSSLTDDTDLALATNSSLIRVYSTKTNDACLLSGHTSIVLSLSKGAGGGVFTSGSKDCTARIWIYGRHNGSCQRETWGCVAVCHGHTESVGATAMSKLGGVDDKACLRFMFTGSQDRTIKMWDLSSISPKFIPPHEGGSAQPLQLRSLTTHRAHEKDINSLDVAPHDHLLASGSQDKTARIFGIEYVVSSGSVRGEIRLLGVCKGHRRGVWNVRFGKTERVLATGSGDKTVKLWSLDDFSCLKTFEGHTNSVLRVEFINQGQCILSSASDGLVKLWDIAKEECIATMDNHEDKVWALTVSPDESVVVSAGADSLVTFWHDATEEFELENEAKRQEVALREQDLANFVSLHDYRNAILLALTMDHSGRLLSLFRIVHSLGTEKPESPAESITGHCAVDQLLKTLPLPALSKLLTHVRVWNVSARTSGIAQMILHAVLKMRRMEDMATAFDCSIGEPRRTKKEDMTLREFVDGILPYTERHLLRIDKLMQDSWVVDLVLQEMDGGLFTKNDVESVNVMNVD